MANKMADARRSLVRAKESATHRLTEIDQERRDVRASIKSLDAALKALGSSGPNRTTQKPPPLTPIQNESNCDRTVRQDDSCRE